MVKLFAACAALCAFFFMESLAEYQVTDNQLQNIYTLTSNVNLYTIWLTNTSLHVNSTDKNLKPCTMAIDPIKDSTVDGIQVKVLANSNKFVIWGANTLAAISNSADNQAVFIVEYMVLLVNPWTCEFKSVQLPQYRERYEDAHYDMLVVPNADSFDIFHPGQQNCSPCRFNTEGERIELNHQLEFSSSDLASLEFSDSDLESYTPSKSIHIQPMHTLDRKQGYFLSRNINNGTSIVDHLDEHFKSLKRLYVDHPIHSVSIWPGNDHPLLSICYTLPSEHFEVHCQRLDSNLQPELSIRVPVSETNWVSGKAYLTHQIDTLGNIYIGLIEESNKLTRQLRYFAYDKTGKLIESHDFDEIDAKLISLRRSHGLYSNLLVGDKFCLVNEELVSIDQTETHQIIRCFDIAKYYKQ